jgi:hypothetical protein
VAVSLRFSPFQSSAPSPPSLEYGPSSACRYSGEPTLEIMLTSIDKDKAKTNPSSVFDKPDDVVKHKDLKRGEKAAIL